MLKQQVAAEQLKQLSRIVQNYFIFDQRLVKLVLIRAFTLEMLSEKVYLNNHAASLGHTLAPWQLLVWVVPDNTQLVSF